MADGQPPEITLWDMILDDADEIARIDAVEKVWKDEGKCLHPDMARRRELIRKRVNILELVREHRAAFVAMVEQARQAPARSSSRPSSRARSQGS